MSLPAHLPTTKAKFFDRTQYLLPELVTMAGTILTDAENLASAHAMKDLPLVERCAATLAQHQRTMLATLTVPMLEHILLERAAQDRKGAR